MKIFRILLAFSLLSIVTAEAATTLEQAWTIAPGANFIPDDPTFALSATSNAERGIAYNPATGNVLITSRTTGTRVIVVDGATGAYKHQLSTSGVSGGGGAVLSMIGVGEDGVVYAANLVTASGPNLKIYRWASDAAPTVEEPRLPEVAWLGDPAMDPATGISAGAQRWGDTMAVRGAGLNTQIAVGSGASPVAIFTTADGVTFTPTYINGVTLNGQCRGIAFGAGSTLYVRGSGNQIPVRRVTFNLSVNPGTFDELNQFSVFPLVNASGNQFLLFTTDVVNGWFAGFDHTQLTTTPDTVRIFDISGPAVPPVPLATANIPTNNANGNAAGSTAMGGGRLYVCDTNNGVVAYNIVALESEPNQRPTVVIQSAAMRGTTGLMDIVFRINDPDDTTVKTRALAFIDGQRSFAKLIKPSTFAEGTASKIGGTIATNTDHTLTWNVAADWNIDLGQIKLEILAMDGRGLLPLDWVTIPAANGQPELTISKNAPTDQEVLDALFWQYASGDPGLKIENGILRANATAGTFSGVVLVNGTSVDTYGPAWAMRSMNLTPAEGSEVNRAATTRAAITETARWHATQKPYEEIDVLVGVAFPIRPGFTKVSAIAAASDVIVLREDGTIDAWNSVLGGGAPSFTGIKAIAAGEQLGIALKNDGTVSAWASYNDSGQANVPEDLVDVVAISSRWQHSLALKSDGTVIAWGLNEFGQANVPADLNNAIAIETSMYGSLAKKSDGTYVTWGDFPTPPSWEGITAVAAGWHHAAGLKLDGTVTVWGADAHGNATVPDGLMGVVAIDCGSASTYALKSDGTVVAWGYNSGGRTSIHPDIHGVTAIAAGHAHAILLKKAP
jgi:hypothetical protein